jgi:hypothetical protein
MQDEMEEVEEMELVGGELAGPADDNGGTAGGHAADTRRRLCPTSATRFEFASLSSASEVNEAVVIKYNDSFYKMVVKKVLHITVPPSYVCHGVHASCGRYAGHCLGHFLRDSLTAKRERDMRYHLLQNVFNCISTRERVTRCLQQHLQNANHVRRANGCVLSLLGDRWSKRGTVVMEMRDHTNLTLQETEDQ